MKCFAGCAAWYFCLFTRLFQSRRISLTLSLFFTSLFTSVMPQLCFPTNLVPFYRICLAFKFRMRSAALAGDDKCFCHWSSKWQGVKKLELQCASGSPFALLFLVKALCRFGVPCSSFLKVRKAIGSREHASHSEEEDVCVNFVCAQALK